MSELSSLTRRSGAWLVIALATACSGDESGGSARAAAPTVRDSAGITIVETPLVDDAAVPHWSIDTTPERTIGVTAGDPVYEFNEISGITRLQNGMLVVLNGAGESAFEFRFYDSAGKHVASHGRRGQGPGEFRSVNAFVPAGGDTLMAVDWPNGRINWLTASTGHLRSDRLDETGFKGVLGEDAYGIVETMVPLGDSLYAVRPFRRIAAAEQNQRRRGRSFHIADLAKDTLHNLARYDETPMPVVQLSTGPTGVQPLEPGVEVNVVDAERRRICAGFTHTRAIECLDAEGKRTSIRWQATDLPYTDADWDTYQSDSRKAFSASRGLTPQDVNTLLAARKRPERLRPFTILLLDAEGNLWVREPTRDSAGVRQSRFRVFDREGRLIAFADPFPTPGIRPMESLYIEDSAVVRVTENQDGAPVVSFFRIRKED